MEKIEKSSKEVQKFSPTGENLEHNNETNTKPDKTEIKSEERQNYGANAPYFAQNNGTNTKPSELELKMNIDSLLTKIFPRCHLRVLIALHHFEFVYFRSH